RQCNHTCAGVEWITGRTHQKAHLMLFAPVERKDYSTITWSDVWSRAEPAGRIDDVFEGLKDGSLKAYVQPSGDPRFYRVPKEHWGLGIFELEGQPAPILLCESDALVPRQFHDLPLLFFEDEVASWEKTLPAHEPIDETDWDYAVFDRYYSQA